VERNACTVIANIPKSSYEGTVWQGKTYLFPCEGLIIVGVKFSKRVVVHSSIYTIV
jgi:hypothetical protein